MRNLDSKNEIYFIAYDLKLETLKAGLSTDVPNAYTFTEFAAYVANTNHVIYFIDGVLNTCLNRSMQFESLAKISPGYFRSKLIYIYYSNIESLRKHHTDYTDCNLIIFSDEGQELNITEIEEILFDNQVEIINVGKQGGKFSQQFNNFQNSEASWYLQSKRQERQDFLTMGSSNRIVLFVDRTWRHDALKLKEELSVSLVEDYFLWIDIDDKLEMNMASNWLFLSLSSINFMSLKVYLDSSAAVIYGGIGKPKILAALQLAQRRGVFTISTPSVKAKFGFKPDCYLQEFSNTNKDKIRALKLVNWVKSMVENATTNLSIIETMKQSVPVEGGQTEVAQYLFKPLHKVAKNYESVFVESRRKSTSNRIVNVLWVGRFNFLGGYGTVARGYLSAMEAAGVPHLCVDIESNRPVGKATGFFWEHDQARRRFIIDGPAILVLNDLPTKYLQYKSIGFCRRIGCTLFETDSFPIAWNDGFRNVDEVWVPTEFNKHTFNAAGIANDRMRILGYALDTEYYSPAARTPSKNIRFLYVVSNLNRKDPGLLIRSFFSAFSRKDPVCLTIKTRLSKERFWEIVGPQVSPKYDLNDPELPEIKFVTGTVSDDVMRSLYEETDIYVTTERAKGWDYPVMEAMGMGIPSLSIDWSGSEFLNNKNAFLISPRNNLARVHASQVDNVEMYFGHRWADVNESEVVAVLRKSVADRNVILEKGAQSRKDVMRYSSQQIGKDLKSILGEISKSDCNPQAYLYY